jgi:ankyrin repeat protein
LLNAGANVNDRNTWGATPLMLAAEYNENPAVVITLLNAGADGTIKSSEGETAFDYAQQNQKLKGTKAYWDLNNARF